MIDDSATLPFSELSLKGRVALEYHARIDPDVDMPTIDWRKGKAKQRVHKAPAQPSAL